MPQLKKWTTTSSKTIFDSPIVRLQMNQCTNPRNGIEGNYYIAQFPDWVNVIAITPEKDIVFIQQYRHGSKEFEFEIPGGCIDPEDHDPIAGAIRELEEETAYIGEAARVIGRVNPNPSIQDNSCYTVLVENAVPNGKRNMDDGEDIEVMCFSLEKIKKMISDGTINNAMVIAAFYYLEIELAK